ncbi:redoxin domain-containing protein [uncultured Imperialibacter sp.]|uniref:TlpA family protein disulfide reductase n=1 Tax=uncultured Imperialibacter sp. TaxID=1672639 RepID=UPI0030DD0174|tara:strand:+ start:46390 stop:46989 length:600 start_codon:yes stop_codon:yes gene_type:complete
MRILILTALLLVVLGKVKAQDYVIFEEEDTIIYSLLNKPAPNFQGYNLKDSLINFGSYEGQKILLHFWSKYCGSCLKEVRDLNRLATEFGNDVKILSVLEEGKAEVTNAEGNFFNVELNSTGYYQFADSIHHTKLIDFEILPNGARIREMFKVPKMFPSTLVIDSEFIIKEFSDGYLLDAMNPKEGNYLHLLEMLKKAE